MRKRIISLVLLVVMAVTAPCLMTVPAEAKTASASVSFSKKELPELIVTTIGIMSRDAKGNMNLSKKVTRAQYAKMLVKASTYKNKVGTTVTTSLYKDVSKSHSYAPYIKIAVSNGWMSGNLAGKFRPNSAITLQEAINGVIGLLGYTDADFQGNKNSAKMSFYEAEDLNKNISKKSAQTLNRKDCMNLFYNTLKADTKEDKPYATVLGYQMDADNEVDYLALVSNKMKGPIVVTSKWESKVPFAVEDAMVYRNGSKSPVTSIKSDDVIYYNKDLKTIWVYSDKVTGKYGSATPDRISPKEVIVAGTTYKIGTQKAAYDLSTMGPYDIGDQITILLGKDNTIVGVKNAQKANQIIGGIVREIGKKDNTEKDEQAKVTDYLIMLDTTGVEHEYEYDPDDLKLKVGDPVEITYISNKAVVNKIELQNFVGTVDKYADTVGGFKIANDANIIDTNENGFVKVKRTDLANITLYRNSIPYYHVNSDNEITDMVLYDVTGNLYQYGILISATEMGSGYFYTGMYTYEINGTQGFANTGFSCGVNNMSGPAQFDIQNGNVKGIKVLSSIDVTSINNGEASSSRETFEMADNVPVYIVRNGAYIATTLSKVTNLEAFELKAYYNKPQASGGKIRVVVARAK